MFIYTSKFTSTFAELQQAKGWDTVMSGYLAYLTLSATLQGCIELGLSVKETQEKLDSMTEIHLQELQAEKVGA